MACRRTKTWESRLATAPFRPVLGGNPRAVHRSLGGSPDTGPCGPPGVEDLRDRMRPTPPYCTSSKILNIGRYIEITTTPTITPTPIIIRGSMIEVSDFSIVATSSS